MENNRVKAPEIENRNDMLEQFSALYYVIQQLRLYCPWDSKQTNQSIAHLLVEETYETIDAIERQDDKDFSKELGDLLLHIIMHAIMAEERKAFNMNDVMERIREKLVFRHPHVFADMEVSGEEEVVENWEAMKMKEGQKSILQGVPKSLPALLRAERVQHKASKVGFDWSEKQDVWEKVEEEIREFKEEVLAGKKKEAQEEFGDLLFALVNAARHEEIVSEEVLQWTNNKFTNRFQYIEKKCLEMGKDMKKMTLEELDAIWDEAKEIEKSKL